MVDSVRAYLETYPAHYVGEESWPVQGRMRVGLSLSKEMPPAGALSSVLGIVLDGTGRVLFLYPETPSGSISQVLIGGRGEEGETAGETVRREVGEETGWRVEALGMIGFRHFFQMEEKRTESDRPYPDFIQPIFAARAVGFDEGLIVGADRITAAFLEFGMVEALTEAGQRPLLWAARREGTEP